MKKLTGTLVYVQLNKPAKAYVKAGDEAKPDEWKASVVLTDEDEVDEYEEFAKSIDAPKSIKKIKTSEFEKYYKVAPPEDAGKNVWVITLRKSTELGKTKKPVPELYRPKVYERVGATLVDVTNSKLPANGSIGSISLDVFKMNNGKSAIYLKNVLVTDMIEYISESSGEEYQPGSEFDDDESAAKPAQKEEKPAKPAKAPIAKKTEDDDDCPF